MRGIGIWIRIPSTLFKNDLIFTQLLKISPSHPSPLKMLYGFMVAFCCHKTGVRKKAPLGDGAELRNAHVQDCYPKRFLYLKKIFFIEVKLIYSVVPVSSVFQRGFTDVSTYSEESI